MKPDTCTAWDRQDGVTLIELMVTLAVISVLVAIAYPSYQRWNIETRRSDAHTALSQVANDLEKFYSECGAYTNRLTETTRSCTTPAAAGGLTQGSLGRGSNRSTSQYYQLSITVSSTGYTISATPQGVQTSDTECNVLTLASTGTKTSSGTSSTRCWRK